MKSKSSGGIFTTKRGQDDSKKRGNRDSLLQMFICRILLMIPILCVPFVTIIQNFGTVSNMKELTIFNFKSLILIFQYKRLYRL